MQTHFSHFPLIPKNYDQKLKTHNIVYSLYKKIRNSGEADFWLQLDHLGSPNHNKEFYQFLTAVRSLAETNHIGI